MAKHTPEEIQSAKIRYSEWKDAEAETAKQFRGKPYTKVVKTFEDFLNNPDL